MIVGRLTCDWLTFCFFSVNKDYGEVCFVWHVCLSLQRVSHFLQISVLPQHKVWETDKWTALAHILERDLTEQILLPRFSHSALYSAIAPCAKQQRASLLFRIQNATGAKSAPLSVWYHPAFVLVQLLSICVWPQTPSVKTHGNHGC